MIDLDAVQARAEAATPGEWRVLVHDDGLGKAIQILLGGDGQQFGYAATLGTWNSPSQLTPLQDARFIAASRSDVLALVAELRAAREVYAELGPVLEPLRAMHARHPGTRIPPCGWCRLIHAYDKAIGEAR
jgi:hypothetical protein